MSKKLLLFIGIALTTVILIAGIFFTWRQLPSNKKTAQLGDAGMAPDFKVKILDGKNVSLRDYRGKPLVINFWASWCGPCKTEMPLLVKTSKKYKGKVQFLGIIYQDTVLNSRGFIKDYEVPYPNALDPTGRAAQDYKITGIPTTFFIDADGHLRASWIGAIDKKNLIDRIEGIL